MKKILYYCAWLVVIALVVLYVSSRAADSDTMTTFVANSSVTNLQAEVTALQTSLTALQAQANLAVTNQISTYQTNVNLITFTGSLKVNLSIPFSDTNYVLTMPANLASVTLASKSTNSFTLTLILATWNGVLEGVAMHK